MARGKSTATMAATMRKKARQDLSARFAIPSVPTTTPKAPLPTGMALPLFDYQRRSLHRYVVTTSSACSFGSHACRVLTARAFKRPACRSGWELQVDERPEPGSYGAIERMAHN